MKKINELKTVIKTISKSQKVNKLHRKFKYQIDYPDATKDVRINKYQLRHLHIV